MCQKAMAAPFGVFASLEAERVIWTRGTLRRFQSSEGVARGYCGDCGTPLTFEPVGPGRTLGLAACAFDDPQRLRPERQIWTGSRLHWLDDLASIPANTPEADAAAAARHGGEANLQHPDHDTDSWAGPR